MDGVPGLAGQPANRKRQREMDNGMAEICKKQKFFKLVWPVIDGWVNYI